LDLLERGVRPSLVVLDLGLPDVNGRDLLTYMHDDVALREVPTVAVTAAEPDRAQVRSTRFCSSCFRRRTSSRPFDDCVSPTRAPAVGAVRGLA
jgi:CheY-like chemotaxis protein